MYRPYIVCHMLRMRTPITTAHGMRRSRTTVYFKTRALKIILVHVILPFFAFSIVFYAKERKMSQKVEKEKTAFAVS